MRNAFFTLALILAPTAAFAQTLYTSNNSAPATQQANATTADILNTCPLIQNKTPGSNLGSMLEFQQILEANGYAPERLQDGRTFWRCTRPGGQEKPGTAPAAP